MRRIVKYSATVAVVMALGLGLSACSSPFKKSDDVQVSASGDTLFEAGLQYVKLVDRDMPGVVNDHPVAISTEEMRTVLESIYVSESVLFRERQSPMFSPGELQILSSALAQGLARAEPSQDLTFVTLGVHSGALTQERQTNSGRVFLSGGRLNIIFGLVREEYRDKDAYTGQAIDRRVNPLLPGSRRTDSEPKVRVALDNGQSYYLDPQSGKERSDWIVIDIPTVLATAAERKGQMQGDISPELIEDIQRNKQETANLREDMANIKEILFEMSDQIESMQRQMEQMQGR